MPRVALKLTPTANGGFTARKRIPEDVQDAYQKLYGVRWEAHWNSNGPLPVVLAQAKAREWLTDIEGRISSIRSERNGQGQTLTPMQARALAGEWYRWFVARKLKNPQPSKYWKECQELLSDAVYTGVVGVRAEADDLDAQPNVGEIWEENFAARADARSLAADGAETSQFLHSKMLTLDHHSRDLFLDYVCRDLFAALDLLIRRGRGDYGPDSHPEEFPQFQRTADPGLTPWDLFAQWVGERKPRDSAVDRWRGVFLKLTEDFPAHGAATLTTEEAQAWARELVTAERSARTVQDIWVVAGRTVFGWGVSQRLLTHNPFSGVRITVPRKVSTRETKAFTAEETKVILSAALAISNPKTKAQAAKRWVPWLCAYTGARVGEITQLRGVDVVTLQAIPAIRITPDAGTVKVGKPRTVPLHEHLLDQAFLEFVRTSGKGPLFYNEPKAAPKATEATNPPKARYVKAREHLAEWVRKDLKITDKELQPNHAWRHTFKQIADRADIREKVSDEITGHAQHSVGRGYGVPTLADKAEALKKFPRYDTTEPAKDQLTGTAANA